MTCAKIENELRKYLAPVLLFTIICILIPVFGWAADDLDTPFYLIFIVWNGAVGAAVLTMFSLFRIMEWTVGDRSICKENRKPYRW